ncbi:MAG: hypothetical protein PHZ26_05040 [Candidatus Gracilibacteria bacterium]|nr:hypothetical protein [Candidatus Gracilibacteria bacterium]MDD2909083.1 hypothetical protein [Candidatus Gracilibacteria bacterium]
MLNKSNKWIELIKDKINKSGLNSTEKAYFERILRVLNMPDLTKSSGNPVNMVVDSLINSEFYKGFEHVYSPEIVSEYETFDLFYFPLNHVARRPSDSYFLDKKIGDTRNSMLLRPHTTVIWFHYLINGGGLQKLNENGEIKILSSGKTYRVDELDKTHHECFHQIDGLKIIEKSKEIINQETLKDILRNTIKILFGENIEYRFNVDSFPYTTDSLEVEVMFRGKRLEVLGAGVVKGDVLEKLGVDSNKYNGWAFGFGIERLAMALKQIPDIRIFWSEDPRITKQWGNLESYKEVSNYPPVYKDISMIVPKQKFQKDLEEEKKSGELELTKKTESDFFAITGAIRDVSGNLIEEVKIIDIYENDEKFSPEYKSLSIKITFRSIERTLTNEEINKIYFEIRENLENELGYKLR